MSTKTIYTIYQCSTCRRTTTVLRDDVRAAPNQCVITKGCEGRLFNVGATSTRSENTSASGLVDWYPRGKNVVVVPVDSATATTLLSTTSTGRLTLAVYQTEADTDSNSVLEVKFSQRRTEDIAYSQFTFRTGATQATSVVGRDANGKNMRFDQAAINDSKVFVKVNGVARFPGVGALDIVLSPNSVIFNTALPMSAVVSVIVYSEKDTIDRFISFTANSIEQTETTSGAWANIKQANEFDSTAQLKPRSWQLYTSATLSAISGSSSLRLDGVFQDNQVTPHAPAADLTNVRFLLAAEPYEHADRYLNLVVEASALVNQYALTASSELITELSANSTTVNELYPPLQLFAGANAFTNGFGSSYLYSDITTTSTSIPTDTSSVRYASTKIIGPV